MRDWVPIDLIRLFDCFHTSSVRKAEAPARPHMLACAFAGKRVPVSLALA